MNILDSRNSLRSRLWFQLGDEAHSEILDPLYDHIATELWDLIGNRLSYRLLYNQLEEDHV